MGALSKSLVRLVPRLRDDALMHIPDEIRPPLAKFRFTQLTSSSDSTFVTDEYLLVFGDKNAMMIPQKKTNVYVHRLEVLFWGVRAMQRLQLLTVDRPSIEIEWSGYAVESDTIANAQKHCNFGNNVKHIDLVRGHLSTTILLHSFYIRFEYNVYKRIRCVSRNCLRTRCSGRRLPCGAQSTAASGASSSWAAAPCPTHGPTSRRARRNAVRCR